MKLEWRPANDFSEIDSRNAVLDLDLPILPGLQLQLDAEGPLKRPRLELEVPSMVMVCLSMAMVRLSK